MAEETAACAASRLAAAQVSEAAGAPAGAALGALSVRRCCFEEALAHAGELAAVHLACFPSEAPAPGEGPRQPAEALARVTAFHDAEDCAWWLLSRGAAVVGFAAGTAYARSYYGVVVAVAPAERGRGFGRLLMHHVQAFAAAEGFAALSATVDASAARLVAYYERLGAEVAPAGVVAPGAPPPPSLRLHKPFTPAVAAAELAESVRLVRVAEARRAALRASLAAAVAAALAAASVAWWRRASRAR